MNRKTLLGKYEDGLYSYCKYIASQYTDKVKQDKIEQTVIRVIQEELTPRQQEVVTMYYFEKYNMVEISKMLGINKSSVSRIISRAKARIKKFLKYNY